MTCDSKLQSHNGQPENLTVFQQPAESVNTRSPAAEKQCRIEHDEARTRRAEGLVVESPKRGLVSGA
jgi:hypothetical protein